MSLGRFSMDEQLERLITEVLKGSKYRAVTPDLIRVVGAQELAARRSFKDAVKATRGRLHQVAGAFLDRAPRYEAWLDELRSAPDSATLRETCRVIMASHASTRERLPQLEAFYAGVFAALPPVSSLLDAACGLNPLATPWMTLAPGARYMACDLYADMCAFIGAALPILGLTGEAAVWDLAASVPPWEVDVALVLKTLPVLEHTRRGAGRDLLRGLAARHLVVSFPTRSLGGRDVGMAATYRGQIEAIATGEGWAYATLNLANEIVFIVMK